MSHPALLVPKRIVIVDDDPLIIKALSLFLRRMGHEVTAYLEAKPVLAGLETSACDVLIVDIVMPDIDGITLIKMVREKFPNLPIIILTGMGYDEDRIQAALALNVNGFVSKTLAFQELYSALSRAVAAHS